MLKAVARPGRVSFRSVNRRGSREYDPSLQRHHLLPRQLLGRHCFGRMFDWVGRGRIGFDDFRANGLLLPANEEAAIRVGLPLHRGPHRDYNAMVIERVGTIESSWAKGHHSDPDHALEEALMRLTLLQAALRRRLLEERRRMVLNRKDPLGSGYDFADLDMMSEKLFRAA